MKIVFLDIDGVLNSAVYFDVLSKTAYKKARGKAKAERRYEDMLDPKAIELLNQLIERSGAKVVISSTWRVGRTPDEVAALLRSRGFVGDVIGSTPVATALDFERGHEIQAWLTSNPEVTQFVIFDDYDDMVHLLPRLVQTTWATGLQPEHIQAALPYLS